jgi:hypothetical protein
MSRLMKTKTVEVNWRTKFLVRRECRSETEQRLKNIFHPGNGEGMMNNFALYFSSPKGNKIERYNKPNWDNKDLKV